MSSNSTSNHIPTINYNFINDKNLGDFNSLLWLKMDFDEVREDLLKYYLLCKDQIMDLSPAVINERNKYKDRRCGEEDNCFTYAMGFLTKGTDKINPAFFKNVDLMSMENQTISFNYFERLEDMHLLGVSPQEFIKHLSYAKLQPLNQISDKDYQNFNPVIAMNLSSDFHFIKADIYKVNNKPVVIFSEKMGSTDASKDYTLAEYCENYRKEFKNERYEPITVGAPKIFVNREVNLIRYSDADYRLELRPHRHFKV